MFANLFKNVVWLFLCVPTPVTRTSVEALFKCFFSWFPLPPTHTPVHRSLLGQTLVYLLGLNGFFSPYSLHSVNCLLSAVLAQPRVCCRLPTEIKSFVSNGKELIWLRVGLTVAVARGKHLLQYSQRRTLLSKVFTAHFEPVHFPRGFLFFSSPITEFFWKDINPKSLTRSLCLFYDTEKETWLLSYCSRAGAPEYFWLERGSVCVA